MKTAISLDDALLQEADRTARSMGVTRSRLFSLALEDYLRRKRQEEMLEQLNRAYADHPNPAESRITKGIQAKFRATIKDRW